MREVLKELKALLIKGCVQHSNVLHTRARTPPGPGLPAGVPGVTGCPRREPRAGPGRALSAVLSAARRSAEHPRSTRTRLLLGRGWVTGKKPTNQQGGKKKKN